MDRKQVKQLLDRYANGECTQREIELLHAYLDSYQDKDTLMKELDFDGEIKGRLWAKINAGIQKREQPKVLDLKPYFKYAAVFIALLSGSIWYVLQRGTVETAVTHC